MKTVLKIMIVSVLVAIVGLISTIIGLLVLSDNGTGPTANGADNANIFSQESSEPEQTEEKDSDEDGLPDKWENKYNLNPNDASDATQDGDGDGLNNLDEYKYNTLPDDADTDGDGYSDGEEIKNGFNPRGSGELSSGGNNTYHVASNGDDSAAGTQSAPWRTLQQAADSTQAGDKIIVHEGTYQEMVKLKNSGASNSPITFTGTDREKTIITGGFNFARDVDHVTIDNLTIKDFDIWGITVIGENNDIALKNLHIEGGEAGIHFTHGNSGETAQSGSVSDVTLEDSVIKNSQYTAVDCTPGPCENMTFRSLEVTGAGLQGEDSFGADGIAVEKGKNITVEQCYIHDNGGDGIDLNSRDHDGNAKGINVKRNQIVRNHKTGIKLWGGGVIENNIVWGQGFVPIVIGIFPGDYELLYNSIAYNMWDKSFSARNYSLLAGYPGDDTGKAAAINLTMLNNIFAFNADPLNDGATGIYLGENVSLVDESNNIYYSRTDCEIQANFVNRADPCMSRSDLADSTWTELSQHGLNNKAEDPHFVSGWNEVDLKLRAGSPAIDAGTSSKPVAIDIEGSPRPVAYYKHDIGAYEYQK